MFTFIPATRAVPAAENQMLCKTGKTFYRMQSADNNARFWKAQHEVKAGREVIK